MPGSLITSGLVLRVSPYREASAMLTILTPRDGLISASARGVMRKNSALAAACQPLSLSEFTILETAGKQTVTRASSLESFEGVRAELPRYGLASYIAETSELLAESDDPSDDSLFRLAINMLYALSYFSDRDIPSRVKCAWELRAACIAGFLPDLTECSGCGGSDAEDIFSDDLTDFWESNTMWLDVEDCRLVCGDCLRLRGDLGRPAGESVFPLTPESLYELRHYASADLKKLLSCPHDRASEPVTEAYLLSRTEIKPKSLAFYHSVRQTEIP